MRNAIEKFKALTEIMNARNCQEPMTPQDFANVIYEVKKKMTDAEYHKLESALIYDIVKHIKL